MVPRRPNTRGLGAPPSPPRMSAIMESQNTKTHSSEGRTRCAPEIKGWSWPIYSRRKGKKKEKKERKKRNAGKRDSAGVPGQHGKVPGARTVVVSKGNLPCKPLWPDTSSPDPGAETCVSASDTCPGKACGPWQHRKHKRGQNGEPKEGRGEGGKETEEKKNQNQNHRSRKNIERCRER